MTIPSLPDIVSLHKKENTLYPLPLVVENSCNENMLYIYIYMERNSLVFRFNVYPDIFAMMLASKQ